MANVADCLVTETDSITGEVAQVVDDGYRALVDKASKSPRGEVLNRSAAHACIIVEYLFTNAVNHVGIITTRLVDATYGTPGVITAALAFLVRQADAHIDILVEGKIERGSALLNAIANAGLNGKLTILTIPKELQKTYDDHLIIADDRHFRYQRDRNDCRAMARFNDPATAVKLRKDFLELKAKCI